MLADVSTATLDVAVLTEHRGRGIGRRLLEAAATAATGLGALRLQLDAHHANEGALRLYRDLATSRWAYCSAGISEPRAIGKNLHLL